MNEQALVRLAQELEGSTLKIQLWRDDDGIYHSTRSARKNNRVKVDVSVKDYIQLEKKCPDCQNITQLEFFSLNALISRAQILTEHENDRVEEETLKGIIQAYSNLKKLAPHVDPLKKAFKSAYDRLEKEMTETLAKNREAIEEELIRTRTPKFALDNLAQQWSEIDGMSALLEQTSAQAYKMILESPKKILSRWKDRDRVVYNTADGWIIKKLYQKTENTLMLPIIFKGSQWCSETDLVLDDEPTKCVIETMERLFEDGGIYSSLAEALEAARTI